MYIQTMSSTLRHVKEPNSTRREFAVYSYRGIPSGDYNDYFFTVNNDSLYRIENDLSGVHWAVARDMGSQRVINTVDPELIEFWENNNGWMNIRVIRPGIARKFQCLSLVRGDLNVNANTNPSYNAGPAWNASAYLSWDYQATTPIYDVETTPVNDMLVIGNDSTTVNDAYTQNLPFGTFWAMNDPLVIEYEFSVGDVTYRRAIKNRIDETTLF